MKRLTFDIEIFPNFFSIIFYDVDSGEYTIMYVLNYDDKDVVFLQLKSFIKGCMIIGYNNKSYDDIILNYILREGRIDVTHLYKLSVRIISKQRKNTPLWKDEVIKWLLKPYEKMYKSTDLMKILAFDKLFIGLKQCSVNLRHDKVQDLPKPFDEPVESHEVKQILEYNKNDVVITTKLFLNLKNDIALRSDIKRDYHVDVSSGSRTYIAKAILNHYYANYSGIAYSDFKNLRTNRDVLRFRECISNNISFKTAPYKKMLNDLNKIEVYETKGALNYTFITDSKSFQFGMGGLHSIDSPAIYNETDDYYIIDADVASFYPRLMINERIKPSHLTDDFINILSDLTDRRLEAKAKGDMSTADALKISINSMFGLLNFKNYWLYDPKSAVSVTINGQLYLLMLIEVLTSNGFEVISANTDGVTARVKKDREDEYYKLCDKWAVETRFELEYAYYSKYIRRDVNNYITKTSRVKEKGVFHDKSKIKKKGAFMTTVALEKAFKNPIVPIAIEKYYLDGVPILDTLKGHTDIYDFCKSQKTGSQFKVYHKVIENLKNGTRRISLHKLQKTNRYFVSKNGGSLVKVKQTGDETNMEVGYVTTILNDVDSSIDYIKDINYNYYQRECNKIIQTINKEVNQTSLF